MTVQTDRGLAAAQATSPLVLLIQRLALAACVRGAYVCLGLRRKRPPAVPAAPPGRPLGQPLHRRQPLAGPLLAHWAGLQRAPLHTASIIRHHCMCIIITATLYLTSQIPAS